MLLRSLEKDKSKKTIFAFLRSQNFHSFYESIGGVRVNIFPLLANELKRVFFLQIQVADENGRILKFYEFANLEDQNILFDFYKSMLTIKS